MDVNTAGQPVTNAVAGAAPAAAATEDTLRNGKPIKMATLLWNPHSFKLDDTERCRSNVTKAANAI